MDKKTKERVKNIASQLEDGARELAKENNVKLEALTVIKERKEMMPPFVFVLQDFAGIFSQNLDLPASTYRILFYFFKLMEYENFISIDVESISENLNINKRTVIRAINKLEELNIIKKTLHINDKRRHEYYINPIAAWKGNSRSRIKAMNKIKEKDKRILELPFG